MDFSFIILNYQSEEYLAKCLATLKPKIADLKAEIILVNNDTGELATEKFSDLKVTTINNFSNLGFAKGCNLGAKKASGDILFFLNPDTELLSASLADCVSLFNEKNTGILAPTLLDANGNPQAWSCGKKITPLGTIFSNLFKKKLFSASKLSSAANLAWVSGAAFLIKKDLFEKIGGFDENFFMYFEDVDLCLRVRQLKKEILRLDQFQVSHYGGGSIENQAQQKKYYYASQDYYFKKHFGALQARLVNFFRNLFLTTKKIFSQNFETTLFNVFLFICILLPFQFALNPAPTVDLAVIRVLIPLLFLACFYLPQKIQAVLKNTSVSAYLILLFLGLTVFSLFFSQNITWSMRKLAFLFSIFPIYFVVLFCFNDAQQKRKNIIALTIGGTLVAIFALLQFSCQFFFGLENVYAFLGHSIIPFFLGKTFSQEVLAYPSWLVNSGGTTYMRAFAPFPDPHMLSFYVGMLLPWSIALWATSKNHRTFFLLASALLAICDIATFTRGGYLALVIAAFAVLPLVSPQTVWKILSGITLFLLLFFVVPKNPVTSPVAGRITSTFDLNEGSNQGRLIMWRQALIIISKNPQGVGIGSYPLAVDPRTTYRTPIYIHNAYLDIASELGIVSAFVFMLILSLALKNFWQLSQKNSFYVAGVASLTVFAMHCLVENPLYSVHVLPLFLIMLALASKDKLTSIKK